MGSYQNRYIERIDLTIMCYILCFNAFHFYCRKLYQTTHWISPYQKPRQMRKILWWMGFEDLQVTDLIIYPTALFWGAQIGRNVSFSETLTFNKKAPQPKEGDDYGAMSFRRQTVSCLPCSYFTILVSLLST